MSQAAIQAPRATLVPGLAIALIVMALNAVGAGLRHAADVRTTIVP